MKNNKQFPQKTAVRLGCLLALSATVSCGCQMADANSKKQIVDTASVDSERTDGALPGISSGSLPEENSAYSNSSSGGRERGNLSSESRESHCGNNKKVSSENGGEASWDSHTTIVLDGTTFDMEEREQSVNAITDIQTLDKYVLVEGHISPHTGYYGFYNTETKQWDKEILGGCLTWYGADEEDTEIPFSLETIVYTVANELYDSNGNLLGRVRLDESGYEEIYGLKYVDTDVEVRILNIASMGERTVSVEK